MSKTNIFFIQEREQNNQIFPTLVSLVRNLDFAEKNSSGSLAVKDLSTNFFSDQKVIALEFSMEFSSKFSFEFLLEF